MTVEKGMYFSVLNTNTSQPGGRGVRGGAGERTHRVQPPGVLQLEFAPVCGNRVCERGAVRGVGEVRGEFWCYRGGGQERAVEVDCEDFLGG